MTGYIVYRNDGAGGALLSTVACNNTGSTALACSVSGLSGGQEYEFAVSALSLAGEGDRSPTLAVSTSPAAVSGLSSDGQTTGSISLVWGPLIATGGSGTTGYIVYRSEGAGGTDHPIVAHDGTGSTATAATVSGLEGGRLYSFVVSGVSAAGTGAPSEAFTQSTSPGAPSGLGSVAQTTSSITLQWTAPAELGGDTASEYVLYRDDGGGESAAVSTEAYRGELSSSVLVEGLVGGRSYKFAVSAVSASGEGDRSEVMAQSTAPAAPGAAPVSVSQTASSIELSWTAPSVSTGLGATGYRVFDAVTSAVVYDGAGLLATEAVVSGLESGRLYSYVVSALSGSGEGDVSGTLEVSTAPGVVTGVSSTLQTSSSITLQWEAPVVFANGSAVSGYKVYERAVHGLSVVSDLFESGGVSAAVLDHFLDPAESDMVVDTLVFDGRGSTGVSTVLSGLSGGVEYTYVVGAVSSAGEGERSAAVAVSTSPAAPW